MNDEQRVYGAHGSSPVASSAERGKGTKAEDQGEGIFVRACYQGAVAALVPEDYVLEDFTDQERARLEPYVTNTDRPVFVLRNLPEVVKGALFARYSRSAKSLRRLLLDEFLTDDQGAAKAALGSSSAAAHTRGEQLYERVFFEYGDDSVAQLGGVHVACEGASNILTKVLEWGRLAAYLEQSTRYVPYTAQPGGRWKYHLPPEVAAGPLEADYRQAMDLAFETYARWIKPMEAHFMARFPPEGRPDGAYRASIRAKALDALRGLLPAATQSNVGVYATGQAYEAMLLRMRAAPQAEVQAYATMLLEELRKVIPAFMRRVDLPDRGARWTAYLAQCQADTAARVAPWVRQAPDEVPEVSLTDFDPHGELKVVAAAMYAVSGLP
ncbi:MAG: FAD-dependent thymidylate synthase, partial [Myxococcota bacterium]